MTDTLASKVANPKAVLAGATADHSEGMSYLESLPRRLVTLYLPLSLIMSIEEALDVLGLEQTPSTQAINDAHRRLEQKLDPELGGSPYLMRKINEARDVLLGE